MIKSRIHTRAGCPSRIVDQARTMLTTAAEFMTLHPSRDVQPMDYWKQRRSLGEYLESTLGGHFTVVVIRDDVCFRISIGKSDACRAYHRMILSGAVRGPQVPIVHCTVAAGELFVTAMEVLDVTVSAGDRPIPGEVYKALYSCGADDCIGQEDAEDGWEDYAPDAAWVETLEALTDSGIGSFDIHNENMMWRADGTLVLTDPVSFRYTA